MEKPIGKDIIEPYFRKKVRNDSKIHNAHLLVHSDQLGIHLNLAEGTAQSNAIANQPFFIASISKLFTSVLMGILVEKDIASYDDRITQYLDQDLLNQLHVYKGTDYTNEIKIKHLLNNTSGLNDFMEDQPKQDQSMIDQVLNNPSRSWTPVEVIQWAKDNIDSHFPPGKGFHYSDTGYHLLGLIIENMTAMPLHEALRYYIFDPLNMNNTYLHRSEPKEKNKFPVANLYIRNIDVSQHKSLSIVYAGGGIISTAEDLLKFMRSLVNGKIIRSQTINIMRKDSSKFFLGINYGYGLMEIVTVPLVMPAKYNAWGNAGSTGAFMFYHPATDAYIIGTLNHFGYGQKGIRFMLQIMNKLLKSAK